MIVSDFCELDVVTVERDVTLFETSKLMRQFHVGYVVVVEDKDDMLTPLGIVTDRDLVVEVMATELDPATITVGDIMQQQLYTLQSHVDLVQCLNAMADVGVRRLPIVSEEGMLIGVATLDEILTKMADLLGSFSQLLQTEKENELKHRH